MIRRLWGTVVDISPGTAVIDVAGVGYLVRVLPSLGAQLESELVLYTHLAVRENALDLYGFESRDELDVFELLLTLPKVGPKSALQILAQADIALLKQAVAEQDAGYLAKLSGIGKKTAEKIVVELKDKFAELYVTGGGGSASPAGDSLSSHHTDIVDALIALGYSPQAARDAAKRVPHNISSTSAAVKFALQELTS